MNKSLMLIILISSVLFVQGCMLNEKSNLKEGSHVASLNQQLFSAVEAKDTKSIEKLLQQGAEVQAQDQSGRTALMIATYNQDITSVQKLIEAGADVNQQDDMLNSPFLYAGAEGYLDILKLTIQAGADPAITNRYGGTALIPASEHGYVDVVRELLTNTTVDVNHVNKLGWTALLEAIILNDGNERQQETIELLIQHGADVNLADGDGVSPLRHARAKGFKEIEAILLQTGAK
ncbi:ankyrin repeat domain-containing protein [Paenibacillus polysaccharolyticus]|uniref:ankyrin repeat domain-containing protein n=1 Tax=Paenibacillus polysaccharolyticus TaxID=582692 RepID=UPI00280AA42B|nr:ankyrin repeat domain-containing protein [Paenibacillus polysaccharolyticus]